MHIGCIYWHRLDHPGYSRYTLSNDYNMILHLDNSEKTSLITSEAHMLNLQLQDTFILTSTQRVGHNIHFSATPSTIFQSTLRISRMKV